MCETDLFEKLFDIKDSWHNIMKNLRNDYDQLKLLVNEEYIQSSRFISLELD